MVRKRLSKPSRKSRRKSIPRRVNVRSIRSQKKLLETDKEIRLLMGTAEKIILDPKEIKKIGNKLK